VGIVIQDIACHLPEAVLSNEQLRNENPDWDMNRVESRAGVVRRHIAADGETSLDLAVVACERLFAANASLKDCVDAIVFCTQSPDHILPGNACLLHGRLDLPESVLALDISLACSGYVYGLAVVEGLLRSGRSKNALLVNSETYSKYIHQRDRSAKVLFGDGAAASWICEREDVIGLRDIELATCGKKYDSFFVPAGGCRLPHCEATAKPVTDESGNVCTLDHIHMDGMGVLNFVNSRVPAQIKRLLERNGLTAADVDLFVFHQASKMATDSLTRLLRIAPDRVFLNLRDVGNTVSASIPIALKDAMIAGRCPPGSKVVLCGFGAGLSWATALYQY
jgi:3-oxoacyl-[acyl-carrier-protein] synthase III